MSILRQEDVDVVLLSCQYRAPEMLRPLVRQMREAAGKPIFVFCMQAGQREEMLDTIQEELRQRGFLAKLQDYEPVDFWGGQG